VLGGGGGGGEAVGVGGAGACHSWGFFLFCFGGLWGFLSFFSSLCPCCPCCGCMCCVKAGRESGCGGTGRRRGIGDRSYGIVALL